MYQKSKQKYMYYQIAYHFLQHKTTVEPNKAINTYIANTVSKHTRGYKIKVERCI